MLRLHAPLLVLLLALGAALPVLAAHQPTFAEHAIPPGLPNANDAAEPSLGLNWNTGNAMFQAYTSTYRVSFPGGPATWTSTAPPALLNMDPVLFTDSPTGRTWAGGLVGGCGALQFTDDDGVTWTPSGNACVLPSFDHPTLGAGPWAPPTPPTALFPSAVYYCAQAGVAQCARSDDGGLTFGPGVPVPCGSGTPGLHGSVHVGPDGHAYLPFLRCGGVSGVGVSANNGLTWTSRPIPGALSPAKAFDPDVATTASGWAYVAYPTAGNGVGAALTKDHGLTWTNFGDVAAAAGIENGAFHEMVAGDDQRAAIAYLGTTTPGNPHAPGFPGVWHLYVTFTLNGGLLWETTQASPNVIQRGWICADGAACASGRNLLDFIDAQIEADGRIVVALADGCINACELGAGPSTSALAVLFRQNGGTDLVAP